MYISGNLSTFENRLHSFATNTGDLNVFANEGITYYPTINSGQLIHWNNEFRHLYYVFTAKLTGIDYITSGTNVSFSYFRPGGISGYNRPSTGNYLRP